VNQYSPLSILNFFKVNSMHKRSIQDVAKKESKASKKKKKRSINIPQMKREKMTKKKKKSDKRQCQSYIEKKNYLLLPFF
jgi:hypothetical protein